MLRWAESGWGEGEGVSEVGVGEGGQTGPSTSERNRGRKTGRERKGRGGMIGKREFSWVIEIKRVGHGGERERKVDRQMQVKLDQRNKERRGWWREREREIRRGGFLCFQV